LTYHASSKLFLWNEGMALEDKVKTALDETRLLILGSQILFGFQFNGMFHDGFDARSAWSRGLDATGSRPTMSLPPWRTCSISRAEPKPRPRRRNESLGVAAPLLGNERDAGSLCVPVDLVAGLVGFDLAPCLV
jgi:hypothetical protein